MVTAGGYLYFGCGTGPARLRVGCTGDCSVLCPRQRLLLARTYRADLMMSVPRGNPEVALRRAHQSLVVLIYVNQWMEQALLFVVFAQHPNQSDLKEAVMQRRQALKPFAGLALCPLCASTGFASEGHWSYEGATGPEKWGGLNAADAACSAGGQQSPIDITASINARQPPPRDSTAPISLTSRRPAPCQAVPLPSSERTPYRGQAVCNGSAFRSRRD